MVHLLLALIYVCFISLGLPDSLLGSAWPVMQGEFSVPTAFAGVVSAVVSAGTIFSSLLSDRLVRRFGSGVITAVSTAMTAAALFGFSVSSRFWMLIVWSIPYGLGAGGVDAVLNNYVALHYKSRHMSWLHCMWGIGAGISPYIMSFALVHLQSWNRGYLVVSVIQAALTVFIFLSLPLWRHTTASDTPVAQNTRPLSPRAIIAIPGAVACFFTFFGYCALEITSSLWVSSYFVQVYGTAPETASSYAALFYVGLTAGRAVNGFLTMKFRDKTLIRGGLGLVLLGVLMLFWPHSPTLALCGFVVAGLGCAPVYPCIIHMTPSLFGRENSQAIIGVQMAFAYTAFLLAPPLFGAVADLFSITLLPLTLLLLLIFTAIMHERVLAKATE